MTEKLDNVSVETPDFAEQVISKSTADELSKIEELAKAEIQNSKDDRAPAAIIKKAEQAKKEVMAKKTIIKQEPQKTIKGLKIALSGVYVGKDNKSVDYEFTDVIVPYTENLVSYMKQIAYMQLKNAGKSVMMEDIITYYRDDEDEIEIEPTFLNKNVLEFTLEEVLFAKMYFKLKQVDITNGIRSARISLYKSICLFTGQQCPVDETNIKKWTVLKLA